MFIITCYRDPGKGLKTGILKAIVYDKNPIVEFDFAAISVTVCGKGEGGL